MKSFFERLDGPSQWKQIEENSKLLELAQKPLFLFMLAVAYQEKSIEMDLDETGLLNAFINRKLREESHTNVYPPDRSPNPDQTYAYLIWLAKQLKKTQKPFLIEDLQPSLLDSDKGEKSLYFRLFIIPEIVIVFLLIVSNLGLRAWMTFMLKSEINGLQNFGLNLGLGFVIASWGVIVLRILKGNRLLDAPIQINDKLTFAFFLGLRKGLRTGIMAGALVGALFGASFGVLSGLNEGLTAGWTIGVIYGFIIGLIKCLVVGLRTDVIDEKESPSQGTFNLLRNSLLGGAIIGMIFGVFFGLIDGKLIGLAAGIIFGITAAMFLGIETLIRHVALRAVLTKNGYTPWKYDRFLEHAVELRFMQRVGGRYRFIHSLIRDHFANASLD